MGIRFILAFLAMQMALGEQSFSLRRPSEAPELYHLASYGPCRCADGPSIGLLVSSSGDSLRFSVYRGHVFLGRWYPPDDYLLPHGYLTPPDASHQHVSSQFLEPCSARESIFMSALQSAVDCALSRGDQERVHKAVQDALPWDAKMDRVRAIAPIRWDYVEAIDLLLFLRSRCADGNDTGELR